MGEAMIQYVVPAVAFRMKPLRSNPEAPPWPQPTKLSASGEPVNTSMAMIWLLGLGSKATRSSLAGVNVYQTLWSCPLQRDESVETSNVAWEISRTSWNGRLVIAVG